VADAHCQVILPSVCITEPINSTPGVPISSVPRQHRHWQPEEAEVSVLAEASLLSRRAQNYDTLLECNND
jgi:hypothetical protein